MKCYPPFALIRRALAAAGERGATALYRLAVAIEKAGNYRQMDKEEEA